MSSRRACFESKRVCVERKTWERLNHTKMREEKDWKLEIGADDFGFFIKLVLSGKPVMKVNVVKEVYDYVRAKIRSGKIDIDEIEALIKSIESIPMP